MCETVSSVNLKTNLDIKIQSPQHSQVQLP